MRRPLSYQKRLTNLSFRQLVSFFLVHSTPQPTVSLNESERLVGVFELQTVSMKNAKNIDIHIRRSSSKHGRKIPKQTQNITAISSSNLYSQEFVFFEVPSWNRFICKCTCWKWLTAKYLRNHIRDHCKQYITWKQLIKAITLHQFTEY